jgi:hypothetical protein
VRRNPAIVMLFLSFVLAFTFATTWVVVMTLTLPPTDGAYGQAPFQDPLVFPVMSIFAGIAGAITFPFLYFALRDRQLAYSIPCLVIVVLIEIILVTPFDARRGFVGSFAAYFVGLVLARRWSPSFVEPGHCTKCGYDLRGTPPGNPCSECGTVIKAIRSS